MTFLFLRYHHNNTEDNEEKLRMGVLPSNYEVPQSNSGGLYVKLQPGENRFRILEAPTTGFIVWKDKQPTRYKAKSDVPAGSEDVKHFWFVKRV